MKRFLFTATFVALGLGVLTAQEMQHKQPMNPDPDKMVAGGSLPAGWSVRLDSGSTKPEGVKVMPMGGGMHFMTGPAGIYYRAADKASGTYSVTATFAQMAAAAHPEAYGLVIGGSGLEGPDQKYTYFLVRQDGRFLIKKRAGAETPTITNWTENAAVKKIDASGKASNTLTVNVAADKVHFLVNGTEVGSAPLDQVDTTGIAGIRVNHNLNVHVDGFSVKQQ